MKRDIILENFVLDKKNKIKEVFVKASANDIKTIKSYKTFKN